MLRKDMSEGYEEKKAEATSDASRENVDEITIRKDPNAPVEGVPQDTLVFINGKRIAPEMLKECQIQYSKGGLLVVEINYVEEDMTSNKDASTATMKDNNYDVDKPSVSGVSIPKSDGPEVYDLEEKDVVKLCAMSSLRANKKKDDSFVSKLKVKASGRYKIEEVELSTVEYDIKDVSGMSSALNDLAVQEQNIQKDPNVVKVREIISPKVVFKGTLFTLTEKFKLYKEKESVDEK